MLAHGEKSYGVRLIFGRTRIDFDLGKDATNIEKHHYSLSCALDIFEEVLLFQKPWVYSDPFMEKGEVRQMHLAEYEGKIVHIVTTMREDETVRVISMRDASKKERKIYKNQGKALPGG